MQNVLVFYGGQSVEHDVSVVTGVLALNTLSKTEYNAIPVYIDNDGKWYTGEYLKNIENYKSFNYKKVKRTCLLGGSGNLFVLKNRKIKRIADCHCAINCLHGERGEDGSLSGLLKLCGIPLIGSPVFPSSLFIDKEFTKFFLKGINVKTLPCVTVKGLPDYDYIEKKIGYPAIVKPATLGSSVGISKVEDKEQLKMAISQAFNYCEKIIVERFLENKKEINCACYRLKKGETVVSPCEMPINESGILTFNDKYKEGKKQFPARISEKLSEKIKSITKKIYEKADCFGIIRIDFFVSEEEVFVNEVNTVPGSLAYYLFTDTFKGFSEILKDTISVAIREKNSDERLIRTYESKVLNVTGCKSKNSCKKTDDMVK